MGRLGGRPLFFGKQCGEGHFTSWTDGQGRNQQRLYAYGSSGRDEMVPRRGANSLGSPWPARAISGTITWVEIPMSKNVADPVLFDRRRKGLEAFNRWESERRPPESPANVMELLDSLLRLLPPEMRLDDPDPRKLGIRKMHALLGVLGPLK